MIVEPDFICTFAIVNFTIMFNRLNKQNYGEKY